jgi:hypothetical protein
MNHKPGNEGSELFCGLSVSQKVCMSRKLPTWCEKIYLEHGQGMRSDRLVPDLVDA